VRLVQGGMVRELQEAGSSAGDVPVPALPDWAKPLVAERSERRVAVIDRLGVHVVGDPARLLLPELPVAAEEDLAPDRISVEAASRAVAGVVAASLRPAKRPARRPRPRRQPALPAAESGPSLAATSGRELVRELGRRTQNRLFRRRSTPG
jgi:hypothetical protein